MLQLEQFFYVLAALAIIVCSFKWMFSAHQGIEALKGIGLAVLLCFGGLMLLPVSGTAALEAGARILLAFVLLLGSVLALGNVQAGVAIVSGIARAVVIGLIIAAGAWILWTTNSGRIALLLLVVIGVGYVLRGNSSGHGN